MFASCAWRDGNKSLGERVEELDDMKTRERGKWLICLQQGEKQTPADHEVEHLTIDFSTIECVAHFALSLWLLVLEFKLILLHPVLTLQNFASSKLTVFHKFKQIIHHNKSCTEKRERRTHTPSSAAQLWLNRNILALPTFILGVFLFSGVTGAHALDEKSHRIWCFLSNEIEAMITLNSSNTSND